MISSVSVNTPNGTWVASHVLFQVYTELEITFIDVEISVWVPRGILLLRLPLQGSTLCLRLATA